MGLYADACTKAQAIQDKINAVEALDLAGLDPSGALPAAVSELHAALSDALATLQDHMGQEVPLSGGTNKPPSQ